MHFKGVLKASVNRETAIIVNERNPKDTIQNFNIQLTTSNACENILIQIISYDTIGTSIYLDNLSLNIQ